MNRFSMVLALLFLPLLAACFGTRGSGNSQDDTRSVATFTEVELHGAMRLDVKLGGADSLKISGDDNLVGLVKTEVKNGRLIIRTTGNMRPNLPLVAHIEAKNLKQLVIHGASDATVAGIDNANFKLEVHGASEAVLSGKTEHLEILVEGASDVDAKALEGKLATVTARGASDIALGKHDELKVTMAGAGAVSYAGTPKVESELNGVGTLKKR